MLVGSYEIHGPRRGPPAFKGEALSIRQSQCRIKVQNFFRRHDDQAKERATHGDIADPLVQRPREPPGVREAKKNETQAEVVQ